MFCKRLRVAHLEEDILASHVLAIWGGLGPPLRCQFTKSSKSTAQFRVGMRIDSRNLTPEVPL